MRHARRLALPALALAGAALAALALALPAYLPLQDVPNHEYVLRVARALRAGESSPFFLPAPGLAFAYTLYSRVDQLLAPLLPPAQTLRLQLVLAALALPLAVGALARRLGGDRWWAALLSLPLIFGWPLRMGFLSYVVSLPIAFAAGVAAIDTCRAARPHRPAAWLAALLALAWVAHPFALVIGALLAALAWLCFGTPRARRALLLAACALPAAALVAHDVATQALALVPAAEKFEIHGLSPWRPLDVALAQLFTYAYGIADGSALPWLVPLLAVMVGLTVAGLVRPPAVGGRAGAFAAVGLGVALLVALLAPSHFYEVFLVGERLPVLPMAIACVPAAWAAARAPLWVRAAAVLAVGLALGHAAADIGARAADAAAMMGPRPPRSLDGERFAVNAGCLPAGSRAWARYEGTRHFWAYALSDAGFMPYAFANRRYIPLWFRPGALARVPNEQLTIGLHRTTDCAETVRKKVEAIAAVSRQEGHGAALLFGAPADVDAALARLRGLTVERIAPGYATVAWPAGVAVPRMPWPTPAR